MGSVRAAVSAGLSLAPEDRKAQGLVLGLSVARNITLAGTGQRRGTLGQIAGTREAAAVSALCEKLSIKCYSPAQIVSTLSGGNQQKVVLAKWLLTNPRVLFLDEHTRHRRGRETGNLCADKQAG